MYITFKNVMYMCITEKKQKYPQSQIVIFSNPGTHNDFFSQVKWSIYTRRKNILSSSLLVRCLFRKGGTRWKILLPCSSIIRRTISHFFELLPRIHSYFTHKNIIFGLFTVLFPSAGPFFCHSVYEQRREWRYTCSDPRRASVACVQKSLRYLIYISFAGHGKTPFP